MNNQESYFLIGGSGFLGNAFGNYLKEKGIVARNILRGEISDSQSLNFKKETIDKLPVSSIKNIIIDFAYTSIPNTSFSDPIKDFTENLYNINCHLAFASHLPNSTYIYISSGGTVYGNVMERKPIQENANNFPLAPYGITKLASEKYAFMHREIYGLDLKIVRPANIYGPGQKPYRGQGFISTAIAKVLQHEAIQIYGDGSITRDYLYIDDFCKALFNVVNNGIDGEIYNVGSGMGSTINDILSKIEKPTLNVSVKYLPERPFDVKYNVLDCEKVKSLNWSPVTSLDDGIEFTSKWVKDYLTK